VAAAMALPGCGGGGSATAESTASPAREKQARVKAVPGAACPVRLTAFVKSLDSLRKQLAVGLSYDQYAARIKGLRAAYDEIPVDRLALKCLTSSGTPAERSFNKYIDAANAWGECLADASCDIATIEPVLQRKWRLASRLLGEAQ
jgi:hypothetical protein